MPELKDSLGLNVHYINPHTGREHAATIVKVREDETVNLIHYDPESGLQQGRAGVAYSQQPIANTFHWQDDDNAPKSKEEAAAQSLSRVTSSQNRTGVPPVASANVPPSSDPAQSVAVQPEVAKTSVELEQASAVAVQPVSGTIPVGEPQDPTIPASSTEEPNQAPPPEPKPVEAAIQDQDQAAFESGQSETPAPLGDNHNG